MRSSLQIRSLFTFATLGLFVISCGDDEGDKAKEKVSVIASIDFSTDPTAIDADGDGTKDEEDACPQSPGDLAHRGCPDSDGDGLYDDQDQCPQQRGPLPTGCPPTDSDGDGVPDDRDRCPQLPGSLNGCPDTDNDGIADPDDRCPTQAGSASNQGCPEIEEKVVKLLEFATQSVQFETGSAVLKTESFTTLNDIARIMDEYPAYSLIISGHTDNIGPDINNQILSEERARACKQFLTAAGIQPDRMTFIGYGKTKPRADNSTASGRRLNRRVEFDLRLL
ncbi:MAG: OmpA family protein [Lewinella sp.]|nr:OmpA family protein [Lewinella sp.]